LDILKLPLFLIKLSPSLVHLEKLLVNLKVDLDKLKKIANILHERKKQGIFCIAKTMDI